MYVDELNYTQMQLVPAGMKVRHHTDFQGHIGADYTPDFGFRGAALFLDLYRLFPSAQWYIGGDDDTFFGRSHAADAPSIACYLTEEHTFRRDCSTGSPTCAHSVVDNLVAALVLYNPNDAWYVGAPSEFYHRVLDLGGFNYGRGCGIVRACNEALS